jgi:hypothetical protein
MTQKIKLTALVLMSGIMSYQSLAQVTKPSIVGKWTETKSTQVNRHEDLGYTDTTFADYQGCSVTFTDDKHYHDISLKSTTHGDYVINGDTLREMVPPLTTSVQYTIIRLTEHELILFTAGYIKEPATATETTITYSR